MRTDITKINERSPYTDLTEGLQLLCRRHLPPVQDGGMENEYTGTGSGQVQAVPAVRACLS